MSNIPSQFSPAGLSHRQNALSDAQFSSYVRSQSVSVHESLNAGLTIETKEGDLVTLNSSSYTRFDAYQYNSEGVVQTEDGRVAVKQNYQEVTLASGERFSFTVEGDLSEQELEDIGAIITGIDGIIDEMGQGDMDDAIALAMNMGGYDSVSSYEANITYERSFSQTSQTRTTLSGPAQDALETASAASSENNEFADIENTASLFEPLAGNTQSLAGQDYLMKNMDALIEKMTEKLEAQEEKLLEKSKDPIDKLFGHHLDRIKENTLNENRGNENSSYNALNKVRKQMEKFIDEFTGSAFDRQLSGMMNQ